MYVSVVRGVQGHTRHRQKIFQTATNRGHASARLQFASQQIPGEDFENRKHFCQGFPFTIIVSLQIVLAQNFLTWMPFLGRGS